MKNSKFFEKIWQFNALVIACIGVAGIGTVLVSIFLLVTDMGRYNQFDTIKTKKSDQPSIKEKLTLQRSYAISGSNYVITELKSKHFYERSYLSKGKVYSIRNLLFSDMNTGNSHWLFADNKQLVLSRKHIKTDKWMNETTSSQVENADKETIAILYKVVKTDSNKDGEINSLDNITVALTTSKGKNYTELPDIDGFGHYQYFTDKNQLSLMAHKGDERHIVFINLANFSVVKDIALPSIQP